VPEDPRDEFFHGDGFLAKVGNFLQRADRASERGIHSLSAGVERLGQTGANTVGLDSVGNWLGEQAAHDEAAAAVPVPNAATWEEVKANPSIANVGDYIGTSIGGAAPSLGAAAVALPLFAGSRLGEVGHARAVNEGRDEATVLDLLKAAPTAAVDTVLMKGGLSGILSGSLPKAVVREGIAQAGMPVADYAGETVGTNVPFKPEEAVDRAVAGLVAGVPMGGAAHLGVRGMRALRESYAARGVDTANIGDDALVEGSLNGSIHPDVGPADVETILQTYGSSSQHFSSPERAAAAAERVRAAHPEAERPSGQLPQDIVQGLRARGIPEHVARGAAAGVFAESAGDHTAVNPSSGATGLGQWLGPRKKALFERYGPNPTREQQIDFLAHELKGGDSGGKFVLAAENEADALNAYIRKFMRPAAGKETEGDISRGLEALGLTPRETVFRAPPPSEDPFRSDSGFERTDAEQKPTDEELGQEGARYARMDTGESDQPFREATDDPEGQPGFWERRAEMQADDLRKEWEASRKEPPPASEDPGAKYGKNNYGQRPHMADDIFAMTDDGHIADVKGKPVAFRNVKDAARFAAKHKLGGDFEPKVWTTNSTRVTLTKRPGSTYGERPARPEGPMEPAAGRSADESQRMIPDWQKAPLADGNGPPARDTGSAATQHPENATGAARPISDALSGSISDPSVSRGTENVPAGPERFEAAPPPNFETDYHPGGTFERPRPEPISGREPPKPRNFARAVIDSLNERSRRSGIAHRIDAQDAINHGVAADAIYHHANARYPTVKVQFARLFSTSKAPLKSRAKDVKLHSLDDLGDRFDFQNFGIEHGNRPEPAEIARLLQESIDKHESAFDRSDPRHGPYNDWVARHDAAQEFEARYGDRWHEMPDEELDRIDADAPIDDMMNHVLGDEAPEDTGHGRAEETEARDAGAGGEDEGGPGRPERDGGEADRRGPAAEDALIPERETDQRDALQRRADERLKPDAEQKPAGSDGGLFDTRDTTGDMFAGSDGKDGIGKLAKDLWNDESGSLNVDRLADLLFEKDADPTEAIRKVRDLVRSPAKTTKGALKALDRFASAVAYSSDGALRTLARHYNAPTITKLADMFQARAGADDATARTYDEALKRQNGRFRSRLDAAIDPFIGDKAAMERIRDLLAEPDRSVRATAKEREAAKEIQALLKDVREYRIEAGEDIGDVKNYFPRVVDSIAVADKPAKFLTAAERLYRDLDVPDPRAAAESWMQRILDTHAGLDGGEEFLVSSGKPSSSKSREFGPLADKLLREFLQKDPLLVLSDYVTGSVRRAEQTRRFGPKGAVNSEERGAWLKEHGTKTQWDVMLDDIRAELRSSGEDADGVVRQVKTIRDGSLGRLGTAGVRVSRAVSTIHAWNQLSTLQKVTLSSIGDLAMGFVRGGPTYGVRHFATSLKEAARLVETFGKRDLSDAHRWAEAMGTVGHGTASQLIQARMDAAPGAVKHASLLNKFYHKVGIEQLTQGGRIAATNNAKIFLDTLAGDLLSGSARTRQRATLYLKELGIKDPQAFGEWLRKGAPSAEELAADRGHAADYATAVVRFADQTVLMPSRAQKPAWANHPVGSLVFALQSYNAAFTQNVLKRVGRLAIEGVKTKDPALLIPAGGMVMLAGMNALQIYLRTAIFGGKGPDDESQFALQVLDRTGLTGMASPFFNALYGTKYHRSISQSLQGSVIGRAGQAADAAAGLVVDNSENTNTAERKAAGLLYDMAIDPAINAFGAKYVRGAGGTAIILGTGNKAGGALPGDRDAFIDAVAGKEKKRVPSE
jgi:hypothetical protein